MNESTLLKYLEETLKPFGKEFNFTVYFNRATSCLIWERKSDRVRFGSDSKKRSLQKLVYEHFHKKRAPRILKQCCCTKKHKRYCLNPKHLGPESKKKRSVRYRVLFIEDKKRMKNYNYEKIEKYILDELIQHRKDDSQTTEKSIIGATKNKIKYPKG